LALALNGARMRPTFCLFSTRFGLHHLGELFLQIGAFLPLPGRSGFCCLIHGFDLGSNPDPWRRPLSLSPSLSLLSAE